MLQRYIKYLLVFVVLLAGVLICRGEGSGGVLIRGIVRDSLTTEGLPYSSVVVDGSSVTSLTDSRGLFELTLPYGSGQITASCQGYAPKTIPVKRQGLQIYDIYLVPQATELAEVVVKKKKYSKRNNPAVDFVTRLRRLGPESDPRRKDWYSYRSYERISMGINNFDTVQAKGLLKRMPDLIEHVDTSEISGQAVLNLSVHETSGATYHRQKPESEKRVVEGIRSVGLDEFTEGDNVQTILSDLLRDVDLYQSDITLLRNTFVSPLSPVAPDFYRFYLVDSAAVIPGSDKAHISLAFYPRNKATLGFQGHLFVERDDTTMAVRRVELAVSPEINLNFVKNLRLTQTYDVAEDGSRLKTTDRLLLDMQLLPATPEIYVSRKVYYSDHSFEQPAAADSIFNQVGSDFTATEAHDRDSTYWAEVRAMPMQKGESKAEDLMTKLRSNKLFYWGERFLHNMVTGYWATGRNSKFDIGPINTTASYNSLEGLRLRAGGMTTAWLSKRWFGRGYVAYGFRDHKWKYSAEAEYSFIDKKIHPREFPVHSIRLKHQYDVDRIGSHYLYTNADNFVLSLARMSDRRFTYLRQSKLEYTLELNNHFSVVASAEYRRQEASPYLPFVTNGGKVLSHYDMAVFGIDLRYAPGETFYQARSFRVPIDETVPVFALSHRYAPSSLSGQGYGLNRTELSVSKLFRLSFMGALDVKISGGHVWGSTVFPELFIPNANLSYTIQPGSFALMNPMEFINSSYVSWHLSYELRGALLNLIPGVRRLGLREVVGFSGIYGHRNKANEASEYLALPLDATVTKMSRPYMELSVGLDNILRFIRLDYVWRLNYLDVPYEIDRRGLRVALHFTF